jgi:endonuclease/exonuclease/phosphatase family metal-dependent hydrolase
VTYRILSDNIERGGRGREVQLAAVINACAADLVVLQEARDPELIRRVAGETAMAQWAARGGESLGFMSREPLASYAWHKPRISRHAFLELQPAGTEARVFGVHLSAVHAAWTESRRIVELRALLRGIAQHQEGFHVLTGDFNTLAPGELLDVRRLPPRLRPLVWLSGGSIRWKTVAAVLAAGYADAWRSLHPEGDGATFPTWGRHLRLDYVFAPAPAIGRIVRCEVVDGVDTARASDHHPLLAEIDAGVESDAGAPTPAS